MQNESMNQLKVFLESFYDAISFEKVQDFDTAKFTTLFLENAYLVERNGDLLKTETITEYIENFLSDVVNFPENYTNGLKETQVEFEGIIDDNFCVAKSKYIKEFYNGEEIEKKEGYYYFTLCPNVNNFKIVSVAWSA